MHINVKMHAGMPQQGGGSGRQLVLQRKALGLSAIRVNLSSLRTCLRLFGKPNDAPSAAPA